MKHNVFIIYLFSFSILLNLLFLPLLSAASSDTSAASRPEPQFDHGLHEEAVDDPGCGACHHVLDTTTQKLVYSEGEEAACWECHTDEASDGLLALREASHASCTACHRKLIKANKTSGPTTCGECHPKQ